MITLKYNNIITSPITYNEIIIRLNNLTTILNPIYVFEFISDIYEYKKEIVLNNENINSYSIFNFQVSNIQSYEDLNNEIIYLKDNKHILKIYQTIDGTLNTKVNSYNGNDYIYIDNCYVIE